MTLPEAIAKFEGWQAQPNNRPTRNNNPGNISWGEFAKRHGATKLEELPANSTVKARYAYFPTADLGFEALKTLLSNKYKGMCVKDMIYMYAPPNENDTDTYLKNLCKWCNCTPNTIIDELF